MLCNTCKDTLPASCLPYTGGGGSCIILPNNPSVEDALVSLMDYVCNIQAGGSTSISAASNNSIVQNLDGIYSATACSQIAGFSSNGNISYGATLLVGNDCKLYTIPTPPGSLITATGNTTSVTLAVTSGTLTGVIPISAQSGNSISIKSDGLFSTGGVSSFTDSSSIHFTLASGIANAISKISATAGNLITINSDGLYASAPGVSSLTVGTTPIVSGTANGVLFQNSSNNLQNNSGFVYTSTNHVGIGVTSPLELLEVQGNISIRGGGGNALKIKNTGGNFIGLTVPSTIASSITFTLPNTVGATNQVLTTDGVTGILSWTSASGSVPAIGGVITGGTDGSIIFVHGAGIIAQDNANLFYNTTSTRMSIGSGTPVATLHITGIDSLQSSKALYVENSGVTHSTSIRNDGSIWRDSVVFSIPLPGTISAPGTIGNTTWGSNAGSSIAGAINCTFIGYESGKLITTGNANTFLGWHAGAGEDVGASNTYIGFRAGATAEAANNNTFIGYSAGVNSGTGFENTYVGSLSANSALSDRNVIIGYRAGFNLAGASGGAGGQNTVIGHAAGWANASAGNGLTSGSNNTLIGKDAGNSVDTGVGNVFLGWGAGNLINGNYNILIGTNSTAIGSSPVSITSSIAFGQNVTLAANNEIYWGSDTSNFYSAMYMGRGKLSTTAAPFNLTISSPNLSSNISAASFIFNISGSQGTGNQPGGSVVMRISPPGSSGSSANSSVNLVEFRGDGAGINVFQQSSPIVVSSGTADQFSIFSKDVNGAGSAYPFVYTENGANGGIMLAEIKGTTGDPTGWNGRFEVNTSDLTTKIYSNGAWHNIINDCTNSGDLALVSTVSWIFGGGSAPSGASNLRYNWSYNPASKVVDAEFRLEYATPGTTVTGLTITFPSDMPTPVGITGWGSGEIGIPANALLFTSMTGSSGATRSTISNTTGTYFINLVAASASYTGAAVWISYIAGTGF